MTIEKCSAFDKSKVRLNAFVIFLSVTESTYFNESEQDSKIKEFSLVNGIDFKILCNLLHFERNYRTFNFNRIDTEILMEKSIHGFRLIDWAVKHNNMLCPMFLELFTRADQYVLGNP